MRDLLRRLLRVLATPGHVVLGVDLRDSCVVVSKHDPAEFFMLNYADIVSEFTSGGMLDVLDSLW